MRERLCAKSHGVMECSVSPSIDPPSERAWVRTIEQQGHCAGTALLCGVDDGRVVVCVPQAGVGTVPEEKFGHFRTLPRVTHSHGQHQGRLLVTGREIHHIRLDLDSLFGIGLGLESQQTLHSCCVAQHGCDVDGC